MTYWVAVCESASNPGVRGPGPGVGSVNCDPTNGSMQAMEVQLMVLPSASTDALNGLTQVTQQTFQIPATPELSAVWLIGFSLPITVYLIARSVGAVINFWRTHH